MSDHNELNICFICSEKYKLMVPFTEVLQTCEEFTVAEVLKYLKFLSILDTTNSHRRICLICVAKVQSCFEFKTLCAQVENMLKFHNEKSKCLENDMEDILEETPIHYFNIEHLNKEKECRGNINFGENICIVPNRGIDQPISSTINHIDSERLLQVKTEPESSEESNNQVVVEVNISSIQQQNTKRRKTAAERMKEYRIRKRNKLLLMKSKSLMESQNEEAVKVNIDNQCFPQNITSVIKIDPSRPKTAAERMKEYRARKRIKLQLMRSGNSNCKIEEGVELNVHHHHFLQNLISAQNTNVTRPKTPAQRMKEYRARKKIKLQINQIIKQEM